MRNILSILITLTVIIGLTIGLASCTKIIPYYQPTIQQGNILNQSDINQLKRGMTQDQVIAVLGTPMVKNNFYTDELQYVYTNLPNRGKMTEKRLTLYFKKGKLVSSEGDYKLPF